ncbi:MAG: hypothetical protein FJ100_16705 [Deltaproteobacteria bacterium]|nr:hypothetical protein [Deltaproteobacteria bacterium]
MRRFRVWLYEVVCFFPIMALPTITAAGCIDRDEALSLYSEVQTGTATSDSKVSPDDLSSSSTDADADDAVLAVDAGADDQAVDSENEVDAITEIAAEIAGEVEDADVQGEVDAAVDPCSAVTSCEDGNPCTDDNCVPAVGCVATPNAKACDDGDACTVGDVCAAAACVGGSKKAASCECLNTSDCAALEDNKLCNGTLYCDAASHKCLLNPASVVTCIDPGLPCVQITCAEPATPTGIAACATSAVADGTPCDDKVAATVGEACTAGTCQLGTLVALCTAHADCAKYEDGNLCNGTLFCNKAKQLCQVNPATLIYCPTVDDSPCQLNLCKPKTGLCALTPVNEAKACDDGNGCTTADHCAAGACKGSADTCACKADSDCAKAEDGNLCNGTLYCNKVSGNCAVNPATVVTCPVGLDTTCAKNVCDKASGKCIVQAAPLGTPCDADGSACTPNDQCENGKCVADAKLCQCQTDGECAKLDDGDLCNGTWYCDKEAKTCKITAASVVTCGGSGAGPCSKVACNPLDGQCGSVQAATGTACADGDVCTVGDGCKDGACLAGAATVCDDGTPCTNDACDKLKGCVAVANAATCTDGDACTVGDGCKGGACLAGAATVCDDGNPCTNDACDKIKGCVAVANAATCTDGDACTVGDGCKDSVCLAGAATVCDDGNPCTADACDQGKGCVTAPNAAACSDGDACTAGDQCQNAACLAGKKLTCDDGNTCTTDGCDPKLGCVNSPIVAACSTGDGCGGQATCQNGACVALGKFLGIDKVGGGGQDNFFYAGALPSGFAVAGFTSSKGKGGLDAWLVRYDADGKKLWEVTWGTPKDESVFGVVARPGGLALGLVTSDGPRLQFYDDAGQETGPAAVVAGANTVAEDMKGLAGGGFVVVGYVGGGDVDSWLAQLKADGTILWQKTYGIAGDDRFGGVAVLSDGFLCSGRDPQNNVDTRLVRTDGQGNVVWQKTYGGAGYDGGGAPVVAGDGFAFTGYTTTNANGRDVWLVRTDLNGNLLWERRFDGTSSWWDEGYGLAAHGGGLTLVGYTTTKGVPLVDGWLIHTDLLGNLQWERVFGESGAETLIAPLALPDGRLVLAGRTTSNSAGGEDAWVVRTDGYGNASCATSGVCLAKAATGCDDKNPCTTDSCQASTGCKNTAVADGTACGTSLICKAGACIAGCSGTGPCDDGTACTSDDTCSSFACVGQPVVCDDKNTCTTDSCDKATGCKYTPKSDNTACDDGKACTTPDVCKSGVCASTAKVCNDNNACTADSCDAGTGTCVNAGQCDDGNACTDDGCDKAQGCVFLAAGAPCSDGDVCTVGDACKGAVCLAGAVSPCDDGNPCTLDTCSPAKGCTNVPVADQTPCGTRSSCTAGQCRLYSSTAHGSTTARTNCALDAKGAPWCWGNNIAGAANKNVSVAYSGQPIQHPNSVSGLVRVAVGYKHSCGVTLDGKVKCWGIGELLGSPAKEGPGQLADANVTGAVDVQIGGDATCVLRTDSNVWCWSKAPYFPQQVSLPEAVSQIAGGGYSSCALGVSGTTYCGKSQVSGANWSAVTQFPKAQQICNGGFFGCAVAASNAKVVHCFGNNDNGELGDPQVKNDTVASVLPFDQPIVQLTCSNFRVCALDKAGQVWCWGQNNDGICKVPVAPKTPFPTLQTRIKGVVTQLHQGYDYVTVRLTDGTLWSWGRPYGLGNGGISELVEDAVVTPVQVIEPTQ